MDLGKKLLNKVKPVFGKKSSRKKRPLENDNSVAAGQPSTSDNRNRREAAANDEDQAVLVPLEPPPISHSPPKFPTFHDIHYSGISYGGGSVHVWNEIHNHASSEKIRPGLKLLRDRVAPSAFHNSAHRVDPPRCHPDTRVAIQKQVYDWIISDLFVRQTWIMWMHGAAGGGKSAIMQSIAELCEKAKIPLASFFFGRTDPARNSLVPFIATLVYQITQKIPQSRDEIFMLIENNPLIFDESLESQLQQLVIQPLLRLQEHFKGYFVVMIDGLDECIAHAQQVNLIRQLGSVPRLNEIPVIFLVASRREPQIEAEFLRKQVANLALTLALDNSDIEKTSDDIRHFVTDKFQEIANTHLRRHLLPPNWPPAVMVEGIITKSSGQFIYAAVVVNYVSSPYDNPNNRLGIVHGIRVRDPSSRNPFAHLDALYQYIFSQVEELDKVLDILAYMVTTQTYFVFRIEKVFQLGTGGLEICFANLAAVIEYKRSEPHYPVQLKFLHASLPDFLRDETRSDKYHINHRGGRP